MFIPAEKEKKSHVKLIDGTIECKAMSSKSI